MISLKGMARCLLLSKYNYCLTCNVVLILRWCPFSVLDQDTRLSFKSREEGAGGDVSLRNCEFVSAVHILNPLCQCCILYFSIVWLTCTKYSFVQIITFCLGFSSLQKTTMPLEAEACRAQRPLSFYMWSPPAPPTCPVKTRS